MQGLFFMLVHNPDTFPRHFGIYIAEIINAAIAPIIASVGPSDTYATNAHAALAVIANIQRSIVQPPRNASIPARNAAAVSSRALISGWYGFVITSSIWVS